MICVGNDKSSLNTPYLSVVLAKFDRKYCMICPLLLMGEIRLLLEAYPLYSTNSFSPDQGVLIPTL